MHDKSHETQPCQIYPMYLNGLPGCLFSVKLLVKKWRYFDYLWTNQSLDTLSLISILSLETADVTSAAALWVWRHQ